ncbi:MAG: PocR ligand-binding domain-containing protein [Acidobacteria bacterium]|nr:PocR ligand-binding domain-containing protein [Acidobacteriota bacterium]
MAKEAPKAGIWRTFPEKEAQAAFLKQFEADLEFFQVLLLLANRSSLIRNVELVMVEDEGGGRSCHRALTGTAKALKDPGVQFLSPGCTDLEPRFCSLINDFGKQEARTCSAWDRAAADRARRTGVTQVYECGAGLVDIAVPVISKGRYIATLYSGQVLRTPPTPRKFQQIRSNVAGLSHINGDELERAYAQVPVVKDEDIQNSVRLLEIFASYLSNSWDRQTEIIQDQQRRVRELRFSRKQFADIMLRGNTADTKLLQELADKIGLVSMPDRALVVKLESEEEYRSYSGSFDLACASAINAIEELLEKSDDCVMASLSKRGVCLFCSDTRAMRAKMLAEAVIEAVASHCDMRVRVGIGDVKGNVHELIDSYHEAHAALGQSSMPIAVYRKPAHVIEELTAATDEIVEHIKLNRINEAKEIMASLPALADRKLGANPENVPAQNLFLCSVLDAVCFAILGLGGPSAEIAELHRALGVQMQHASGLLELQQEFLHAVDYLLAEARRLYLGRHEKIVERARRLIAHMLEGSRAAPAIVPHTVAARLGISAGHLSRLLKRTTGMTFERYVMVQRVELAKRRLLDPSSSIAEVAERCGFCNSSYFSHVFHAITGCSPRDYSNRPEKLRTNGRAAGDSCSPTIH